MAPPPGSETTWFEITTATLNSSEIFVSFERNWPNFYLTTRSVSNYSPKMNYGGGLEYLLAICQFAPTHEIHAEKRRGRIHNLKTEPIASKPYGQIEVRRSIPSRVTPLPAK